MTIKEAINAGIDIGKLPTPPLPFPMKPKEIEESEEDDSYCGDPSNHDDGDTDGCVECGMIRLNL